MCGCVCVSVRVVAVAARVLVLFCCWRGRVCFLVFAVGAGRGRGGVLAWLQLINYDDTVRVTPCT